MRSNVSVINVFKKSNHSSEVVTQLLYGETFKKIKKVGSWIKIKNELDGHKGYIIKKNFFQIKKLLIKFVNCMPIYILNQV